MLTRRSSRRGSQRRGLILAFLVVFGLFGVLVGGSVLGAGAGAIFAFNYFATGLPDPHLLDDVPLPQSSVVYDRTGAVVLARFECQNRESVDFAESLDAFEGSPDCAVVSEGDSPEFDFPD